MATRVQTHMSHPINGLPEQQDAKKYAGELRGGSAWRPKRSRH